MAQLELFEGPHTRKQLALHQLLGFDPQAARLTVGSLPAGSWTRKGEEAEVLGWIALEEEIEARLARAPEEALAHGLRDSWQKLQRFAGRLVRSEEVLTEMRRGLFRRVLSHRLQAGREQPAFLPDGTPSGWLFLSAGDIVAARPLLEKAVEKRPQDGLALGAMADLLHLLGSKLKSRSLYREAFYWEPLRVDRDQIADPEVKQTLASLAESKLVPEGDPPATWACAYGCVVHTLPLPPLEDTAAVERARVDFARLSEKPERLAVGLFRCRLFYNGLVLAQALGRAPIHGMDLGEVRRRMKLAHPNLFELHMAELAADPSLPLG